jgi:steroid delta-isomerase
LALTEAINRYFAAVSSLDASAYADKFSEHPVVEDPVGTPPLQSRAALEGFLNGMKGLIREVHFTPAEPYICGNEVAAPWRAVGTGVNGRTVEFSGVDVMEFNADEKIVRLRAYWDAASVVAKWQG